MSLLSGDRGDMSSPPIHPQPGDKINEGCAIF